MEKKRVLLDTDANNEIDDQHAIAYLLLNGGYFEVDGITVNRTNNGGDIEEQAREADRIIQLCDLAGKISPILGASGAFEQIFPWLPESDFDGKAAVDHIIERSRLVSSRKLILVPIGKLTNIALALAKAPDIVDRVEILWLGSNYPDPGEYNLDNDVPALNYILDTEVPFGMAVVRYFNETGTSAVRVTLSDIEKNVVGRGPVSAVPVVGRNGGEFSTFGDYSLDLLKNVRLSGNPPSRALYDMAAIALIKNAAWSRPRTIPAPSYVEGGWKERPTNSRTITLWEHFDSESILQDFYNTLQDYKLAEVV